MWVVYSLLALLGLILLLLLVPVYGRAVYDGELRVKIWVLGIPVTLFPAPPREEKPTKTAKKKSNKPSKAEELKELLRQDGVAGTLDFLRRLATLAGKAAGRLLRAVAVDKLSLSLLIATGDPADTAQRYGQVCGVLYPSLAAVERMIRVRRRALRVEPNFLLEESRAAFDVKWHLSVIRLLAAGIALLFGLLMLKETNAKEVV
ncbi:MAG: DUF2953 domain-containing protein [Clostridia bacterium]|nr:DUF2953 domain-containing protein [Clostridia bacterium]